MIVLGDIVKDKITGFEGVVIAKTEWLYGCIRIGIQSRSISKEGTIPEAQWIDIAQAEIITKNYAKIENPSETDIGSIPPGGSPTPIPKRNIDPISHPKRPLYR